MTLKQKAFIKKYIEHNGNATKAVKDIYNVRNDNSASVIGSRLLRNVKVSREIDRIIEADKTFLPYILNELKYSIENGSEVSKYKALMFAFKLHGIS